jgi:hypothetical protein
MRVINAPYHGHIYFTEMAVFLAGGIKGCRDWQAEVIEKCKDMDGLVLLNPRAGVFDSNDAATFTRQVEWEHYFLDAAYAVSFWFSKETMNPITLYELGVQMGCTRNHVLIGSDPAYVKLQDVKIQTKLAGWEGTIVHSTDELVEQIGTKLKQFRFSLGLE